MNANDNRAKGWLVWGAVFLFVVYLLDRIAKSFMLSRSSPSINKHIAFGIPLPLEVLYTLLVIFLAWVSYAVAVSYKKRSYSDAFLFTAILVGALSNIQDRFMHEGVVDYIRVFSWFPVFNIADMLIVGSVIILITKEFFLKKHNGH